MGTSLYLERESELEQYRQESAGSQWSGEEEGDENLAKASGGSASPWESRQVAAPGQLSRLIGVQENPVLFRLLGVREIASGLGILTQDRRGPGLWSRVAGDAVDRPSRSPLCSIVQRTRVGFAGSNRRVTPAENLTRRGKSQGTIRAKAMAINGPGLSASGATFRTFPGS